MSSEEKISVGPKMDDNVLPVYPDNMAQTLNHWDPIILEFRNKNFLPRVKEVLIKGFGNMTQMSNELFSPSETPEVDDMGHIINPGLFTKDPTQPHFTYSREYQRPTNNPTWEQFFVACENIDSVAREICIELARQFDSLNVYHRAQKERGEPVDVYGGLMTDMIKNAPIFTRIGSYQIGIEGGPDSPQTDLCCFKIQWWASEGKLVTAGPMENINVRQDLDAVTISGGKELAELMNDKSYKVLYKIEASENEAGPPITFITSYIYLPKKQE